MPNSGKITSIEEQKKTKNRYSVFIDGRFAFGLDDETLYKSKIKVGDVLTEDIASGLIRDAQYMSCKDSGIKLVSKRLYTFFDLKKKLCEKEFDEEIASEVCQKLSELGLLDDEAFAKAYISDAKKLKGKGARLIKTELLHHGVDKNLVSELMLDFDNPDGLEKIISKKLKGKTQDRKTLNNLFAACMRKGYNADEIKSALKKYTDEEFIDE